MYVFINYKQQATPDHEFAACIEGRLRAAGHRVFRDEAGTEPSEEWTQRLWHEIKRSKRRSEGAALIGADSGA